MGIRIKRPDDILHREFIRYHLKERWGKIHYIRLGKHNNLEYATFCKESISDEFYHSFSHEVFYFKNDCDLALFKLRFGV